MLAVVDIRTIALLSGPLVGAGYFLGSIQWRILHTRWKLRTIEPVATDALTDATATGREGEGVIAVIEAAVPLVYALIVWRVIDAIAPGGRGRFDASSFIGALSNQVLPVWQSLALWTGVAAVLGHVAPIWTRFRGGTGIPPAMALLLAFASMGVRGRRRGVPRRVLVHPQPPTGTVGVLRSSADVLMARLGIQLEQSLGRQLRPRDVPLGSRTHGHAHPKTPLRTRLPRQHRPPVDVGRRLFATPVAKRLLTVVGTVPRRGTTGRGVRPSVPAACRTGAPAHPDGAFMRQLARHPPSHVWDAGSDPPSRTVIGGMRDAVPGTGSPNGLSCVSSPWGRQRPADKKGAAVGSSRGGSPS